MQRRKIHRLHQKLFRSVLNGARRRMVRLAWLGKHQHGNSGVKRLHVPQQLRSVAVGKRKIEDGCVRPEALQLHLRVVAVGGFGHDVAAAFQENCRYRNE